MRAATYAATKTSLDAWDYAALEMIGRGNRHIIPIKLGTMRTSKALLKLASHGLIFQPKRELTFDEREHIQSILDSTPLKQYADRLERMKTDKVKERLEIMDEVFGDDMALWDLTSDGKRKIKEIRSEIEGCYKSMNNDYNSENGEKFYEYMGSYESQLPLLVTLGFIGPAMEDLLTFSDAQYNVLVHNHARQVGQKFGSN